MSTAQTVSVAYVLSMRTELVDGGVRIGIPILWRHAVAGFDQKRRLCSHMLCYTPVTAFFASHVFVLSNAHATWRLQPGLGALSRRVRGRTGLLWLRPRCFAATPRQGALQRSASAHTHTAHGSRPFAPLAEGAERPGRELPCVHPRHEPRSLPRHARREHEARSVCRWRKDKDDDKSISATWSPPEGGDAAQVPRWSLWSDEDALMASIVVATAAINVIALVLMVAIIAVNPSVRVLLAG